MDWVADAFTHVFFSDSLTDSWSLLQVEEPQPVKAWPWTGWATTCTGRTTPSTVSSLPACPTSAWCGRWFVTTSHTPSPSRWIQRMGQWKLSVRPSSLSYCLALLSWYNRTGSLGVKLQVILTYLLACTAKKYCAIFFELLSSFEFNPVYHGMMSVVDRALKPNCLSI